MPTYIMLTERNLSDAAARPATVKSRWSLHHPVESGAWCAVDIFEAPNLAAALLISTRITEISGRRTQLWPVETPVEAEAPAAVARAPAPVRVSPVGRLVAAFIGRWATGPLGPSPNVLKPVGKTD